MATIKQLERDAAQAAQKVQDAEAVLNQLAAERQRLVEGAEALRHALASPVVETVDQARQAVTALRDQASELQGHELTIAALEKRIERARQAVSAAEIPRRAARVAVLRHQEQAANTAVLGAVRGLGAEIAQLERVHGELYNLGEQELRRCVPPRLHADVKRSVAMADARTLEQNGE